MNEEEALNATPGPSALPAPAITAADPLSKNQQKKLARRAKFQEHKLEKRIHEKERRRERKKALNLGYEAGTLSEADRAAVEKRRELERARKAASKGTERDVFPGAIVIDMGFDQLMTDGEITSIASQLTFCYSVNRTAKRPFAAVLHTSFGPGEEASPRVWGKLGKSMWHRWSRSHFWEQGVDVLAKVLKGGEVIEAPSVSKSESQDPAEDLTTFLTGPNLPATIPASNQLVYLSADAEEELTTLSPNEIYVIGGIVDRNRHKMLCQNKAEGLGIRTARLPIGSFIENMPTRKVLTVNQVFEILTQYNALGDWKAAFEAVIPSRKFYAGREQKTAANKAKKEGDEGDDTSEVGDDVVMEEEAVNDGA